MSTLRGTFRALRPYAKHQWDALPSGVQRKLRDVLDLARSILGTNNYATLMDIAGEEFGEVTRMDFGTVAYMFRAWTLEPIAENHPDMEEGCSLERSGVLPGPREAIKQKFCANHLGTLTKDGFKLHYSPPTSSNSVYVYVYESEGVVPEHAIVAAAAERHGFSRYAYVLVDAEGKASVTKYYGVNESLAGDSLSSSSPSPAAVAGKAAVEGAAKKADKGCGWNWAWIIAFVVFVFFILIVVAILWCCWRRGSPYEATNMDVDDTPMGDGESEMMLGQDETW